MESILLAKMELTDNLRVGVAKLDSVTREALAAMEDPGGETRGVSGGGAVPTAPSTTS